MTNKIESALKTEDNIDQIIHSAVPAIMRLIKEGDPESALRLFDKVAERIKFLRGPSSACPRGELLKIFENMKDEALEDEEGISAGVSSFRESVRNNLDCGNN